MVVQEGRAALSLVVAHAVQGDSGYGPLELGPVAGDVVPGAMALHIYKEPDRPLGPADPPAGDQGADDLGHLHHHGRARGTVGARPGPGCGVADELHVLVGLVGAGDVRQEVLGLSLEVLALNVCEHLGWAGPRQRRQVLRRVVVHYYGPGAVGLLGGHAEELDGVRQRLAGTEWSRLVKKVVGNDPGHSGLHGQCGGVGEPGGSGGTPNQDRLAPHILYLEVLRPLAGAHVHQGRHE